jgi:hypothetical protein
MRPSVQQPISKDKTVMARTRKYYLKNNYMTLRSKVKVSWRSLRYATHRLMIMHSHTKYHLERQKCYGPNKKLLFKNTIIWPWGQSSRSHKGHYGTRHIALWLCTHTEKKQKKRKRKQKRKWKRRKKKSD